MAAVPPRMHSLICKLRTLCFLPFCLPLLAAAKEIPEPLKAWEGWATWDDEHRWCPTPYSDAKKHLCFWPSRMGLQVTPTGGVFDLALTVFHHTWVPLPGGSDMWPIEVKVNGAPVPVVEHDGHPSIEVQNGTVHVEGSYRWATIPQRIAIPREVGLLALVLEGKPVAAPVWDNDGYLWLKRDSSTEEADKNFLSVKLYGALEDGNPQWLRTEIELTVSGKSREEELGSILPEGWKLSAVDSPIPVAVDEHGRMKAQVRAGKWTVHADAFRLDNPKEFHFAADAKPPVTEELIAFKARPEFRVVEIVGAPAVDISQTSFPAKWQGLPVYRWDLSTTFKLEERMRGMGQQKPEGLRISRDWWLDEDGGALTFRDRITGHMQQIWRLDAAQGQDLGSVRSAGQGQLITRNPQTGAPGVEIRKRNLDLEATGRMARARELSATGWQADADAVNVTLHLPPGWRLFALFGADWVRGDWLTSWTLLDLFLLLIFALAVLRLWGVGPAILALLAFGLSYHEPGAPRYLWIILLVPLALVRVVPAGRAQQWLGLVKWLTIATFILVLVPFVAKQVQQALYPQLERVSEYDSTIFLTKSTAEPPDFVAQTEAAPSAPAPAPPQALREAPSSISSYSGRAMKSGKGVIQSDNLAYDSKARIQTGPGVPEWNWRAVSFGWNGPVIAGQQVRAFLISRTMERMLTVLRVGLMLGLFAVLLGRRSSAKVTSSAARASALLLVAWFAISTASASGPIPDEATLKQLRERLLQPSEAYPNAADIPLATLSINERQLILDAEVHAAVRTAVPLPGRLPSWSPVAVFVDDKPEVALRRDDGYLWLVLEAGVHRVHVEGSLANVSEWEWTFLLKPRQVKIDAPSWTVTGVKPGGIPEGQVFFALKQKTAGGQATYDRQEYQTIAAIDRTIELGLVWQVHNTVTRLSPVGKALSLRVPLLPGESVLSSNAVIRDGFIEVRLGAQEPSFSWESNLAVANSLKLATRPEDSWVERWHLVASPVWNVALAGLPPIFEPNDPELTPVWQPWPGESVELAISRPEAIAGATMTVSRVTHAITLGKRQRASKLELAVRCSLGEDFLIGLPGDAEIAALSVNGKSSPVRQDAGKLMIPLQPGEQTISVEWKTNTALGFKAAGEEVRLPVECANVQTTMTVPEDRWVLGASGPTRGPAVRFWGILICSLLAALGLGRVRVSEAAQSSIRTVQWMLLVIGLTQVPLAAALIVVGWLFLLTWRGSAQFQSLAKWSYNTLQILIPIVTLIALGVLISAVSEGLLGTPEMFITGNSSTHTLLRWFEPRSGAVLPSPVCLSISIWWYRFFMLAWALWLAAALINWLKMGWRNYASGPFLRRDPKPTVTPPPLPPS